MTFPQLKFLNITANKYDMDAAIDDLYALLCLLPNETIPDIQELWQKCRTNQTLLSVLTKETGTGINQLMTNINGYVLLYTYNKRPLNKTPEGYAAIVVNGTAYTPEGIFSTFKAAQHLSIDARKEQTALFVIHQILLNHAHKTAWKENPAQNT